ncbi:hypothetical protein [Verminephrobacter eiseniae]|uniref:hypothetical protein n=1 Tax=Verminephrobacter eiseniae TaxID=364317 RepID=UPI0022375C06|nr:hypothetical protein [Verminephrobacter eiseniae]
MCDAYKKSGANGAWGYLVNQRQAGLDRYDDNLAAADRFADMMDGNWSNSPPLTQNDFNFGQYLNKLRRNIFSGGKGNGSKDAGFVAQWGAIGAFYNEQGMNWDDWASKNCGCGK